MMAGPDFQVGQSFTANEPLRIGSFRPSGALAVSQGLDEAANQLDAASRFYLADQERLGKFQALSALDNAQTQAAQRLEQMKLEAKPGALGLTKDFKDEREKIFGPIKQNFPAKIKAELDYQATQIENNLAQQAFSAEMRTRDAYYKTTLDDTMADKLNSIDANPENYWASQKTAIQMIDSAGITTTDKEHYFRTWKANSQIALFNKNKEIDPEKAAAGIGAKVKITNPDKLFIMNAIRKEANETGLTDYQDVAVAVAAQESNFKVDATSPTTGVRGIFQLDESSRKRHGYTPDLKGNISAGLADMRERITTFKQDFGRYPTPNEYYVYHYQGIGGGKAILKADPSASMFDTLAKSQSAEYATKVFKQNPWLNPQSTNAEYIAWSSQIVNNKMYQTGGKYDPNMDIADPTYKDIPYDKRIQLRNSAEAEVNQKEATDYRISHNLEAETKERTFEEGVTLFRSDKLTQQWVDQNSAALGPQQSLQLDNLLKQEDKASSYSPDVHADLLSKSWAVTNPSEATDIVKQAMKARADKNISKEDYKTIENLLNKAQSDGIARKDLVGINTDAIKANLAPTSKLDLKAYDKTKASALGQVEYRRWALDNPNATTEDHSKKVAEVIRGAKLQAVGLSPNTNLKTVISILGSTTPQTVSESDLYKGLKRIGSINTALYTKKIASRNEAEKSVLSKKQNAARDEGDRIKDILEWKGTPFDSTRMDEFNKPITTDKPSPAAAADSKPSVPTAPKTKAQSEAEGFNILGLSGDTLDKQHQSRLYNDPKYAASIIREQTEERYYQEHMKTLKTEYTAATKDDAFANDPESRRIAFRNMRREAEASAKVKAEEFLGKDESYQREIKIARGAGEAYSAAYRSEKEKENVNRKAAYPFYIAFGPTLERRYRTAAKQAKRDYILSERQK